MKNKLRVFLIILISAPFALAQTSGKSERVPYARMETKPRCISGDCENGWGTMYAQGNKYYGPFIKGSLQGMAKITYQNGDFYEGQVDGGLPIGIGFLTFKETGYLYIGEWKRGFRHGQGMIVDSEDNVIEAGTYNQNILSKNVYDKNAKVTYYDDLATCQGNCDDGFGIYKEEGSLTLIGFLKDQKSNGIGIRKEQGLIIKGNSTGMKYNGYVIGIEKGNYTYHGLMVDGFSEGYGILTKTGGQEDAGVYYGEFKKVRDF